MSTTDPTDPTEPVAATGPEAPAGGTSPPTPPASPAPPHAARGVVSVAWWVLALGALGFLLLGSLLTFVGTKATDDAGGGQGDRHEQVGPMMGRGWPGPHGQMPPGGPGGPRSGPGNGQFGPPEQFEDRDGPSGRDAPPGDRDQGDSDTTDTTEGGSTN